MFLLAALVALVPAAGTSPTITALAPSADGRLLFVAQKSNVKNETGFVCVWDLAKPELKTVISGLPSDVRTIQPTADGKRFVLIAGDRWRVSRIDVFDTTTKKRLHSFDAPGQDFAIAAVSPDGNWVATRAQTEETGHHVGGKWRVWNTETGKHAEQVEKAVGAIRAVPGFSSDSKRLVLVSPTEYAEFDLSTGKKEKSWERDVRPGAIIRESGGWMAVLPNGKGAVIVSPTGSRRQTYVVRIFTEKKDWRALVLWDFATPPIISPDGRQLIVSGGGEPKGPGTFVLKLNPDGSPELDGEKPAWSEWSLGEGKKKAGGGPAVGSTEKNRGEPPRLMVFSANGKRVFGGDSSGNLHVHTPEKGMPKATLFVATPVKDELPDWHIVTPAGEFVASPMEAESLAKAGKVKDAAKVLVALGVE